MPRPISRVRVQENGPLELLGDLRLGEARFTRMTLCRCGLSANKPFCDFSHVAGGFTATGEPAPTDKDGETRIGDALDIRPVPNGPVGLVGPVEVTSGSGARIARADKLFLCCCGQSANKPFCDGSHKAAGFSTGES